VMLCRREVLTGSASLAVAAVLAACAGGSGGGGGAVSSTSPADTESESTVPVNSDPVVLKSVWKGESLTTRVGPAVVQGGYTVVRLNISADSSGSVSIGSMFGAGVDMFTMAAARLTSLRDKVAYVDVQPYVDGLTRSIEAGSSRELFAVFGAVPDGMESVELFLPNVGVALGVPVVDAASAGFDVEAALAGAKIDEGIHSGPFDLKSLVVAADGSSDTESDDASTTVNVSGDVLFATDSAELSDQADEVLGAVVEQLELYPSGGSLAITGYTDDVNTDEHNQDLSERRAQSVSDRLGGLADLSGWDVSVSGKGESEPRVPNDSDENRQLNRRVEILMTPSDPDEVTAADTTSAGGAGDMPEPKGPVGRGPDGADIEIDGVPARISLESVARHEGYLIGTVKISSEQEVSVPLFLMQIPDDLRMLRMWSSYATSGCTLLKGGSRYLVVDFTDSKEENRVLGGMLQDNLSEDDVRSIPVVWPDTGEDTVTMDMIGEDDAFGQHLAVRLTDIPVVDA